MLFIIQKHQNIKKNKSRRDKMNHLQIASLIVVILLIGFEYYGAFSERIFVLTQSQLLYLNGIFQYCINGNCVWFDKNKLDTSTGIK